MVKRIYISYQRWVKRPCCASSRKTPRMLGAALCHRVARSRKNVTGRSERRFTADPSLSIK